MFTTLESTNWIVRASYQDDAQFMSAIATLHQQNRVYQGYFNCFLRTCLTSLQALIAYQSAWLLLIEMLESNLMTALVILLYMGLVRSFYLASTGDSRARFVGQLSEYQVVASQESRNCGICHI